ncbi:hypothetical protein C922_04850 [Plasmodium inui San Antonio 1]|uniref:Uncharacterized protein n=1 Tax=Plasmodium inui San Antonio 1 TaxID=1237626 RepID=W6ZZT8_9APIC|nr:hypothetical protein C922_04850 [Plasmodium inui San Antonio 1]EUD64810.1 hypothetical protein C922_04850 [Plasmodium inui San Antonio 1]
MRKIQRDIRVNRRREGKHEAPPTEEIGLGGPPQKSKDSRGAGLKRAQGSGPRKPTGIEPQNPRSNYQARE